jgi:hypothetical protein
VQQLIVHPLAVRRVAARKRRDGLDALTRRFSKNAEGVDGERLALATVLQVRTDLADVLLESSRGGCVHFVGHTARSHET